MVSTLLAGSLDMCNRCNGRRHIMGADRKWKSCPCVDRAKDDLTRVRSGLEGRAKPVTDFGQEYGRFVRSAINAKTPSWLCGEPTLLLDAANSALEVAVLTDRKAKLVRLGDLVDSAFERARKEKLVRSCLEQDFLILLCGSEPPHKWNVSLLVDLVTRRRTANKSTMVAATGDLRSLYGEDANACFKGLARYPSYRLQSLNDDE